MLSAVPNTSTQCLREYSKGSPGSIYGDPKRNLPTECNGCLVTRRGGEWSLTADKYHKPNNAVAVYTRNLQLVNIIIRTNEKVRRGT